MMNETIRWRHDVNNLLGKILAAAELALIHSSEPAVHRELKTIIALAEPGCPAAPGRPDAA